MLLRRSLAFGVLLMSVSCSAPQGATGKPRQLSPETDRDAAIAPGKAGHGTFETRLGYYTNGDGPGDGNPFLDEELTVIEPVFYLSYNTEDETAWWGKFSYDNVSSASIDRLDDYPGSQQSGASGDNYFGLDVGRRHQSSDHQSSGMWGHVSAEYDYRSFGLGGSVAWDAADRNTTDKIHGNVFYDDLDLIRFNGTEGGSDNRLSATVGWTRYQVVSKATHAEFGGTFTYQNGFLGTPYNAVVLEDPTRPPNPLLFNNARGVEIAERLPDSRLRAAIHGRVRKRVAADTALEIGGRVYADDWGLMSVSLEPKLFYWLVPDRLRARVRYGYYTQTAADDFQASFTEADRGREFLTQDSDLGDFDSHTTGFGLTWAYSDSTDLHLAGDYVLRSDGIDQLFASFAWSWKF